MWDAFECRGKWYLPGSPERRIVGTLKFTPGDGARLSLEGYLTDAFDLQRDLPIVLGDTVTGDLITLRRCFETKKSLLVASDHRTSEVYAHDAFVGAQFSGEHEIRFRTLTVGYSHLDEWVNKSGFEIDYGRTTSSDEVVVRYKPVPPVHLTSFDGYRISICTLYRPPTLSLVQTEATISQRSVIRLEAEEPRAFDEYWQLVHNIQNFLSLAAGGAIVPLTVEGTTDAAHPWPVKVFRALKMDRGVTDASYPHNVIFEFRDVSETCGSYLDRWLELTPVLEPVYELFFGTLYNTEMYLEQRFLSLAQAIECYHSRVIAGRYQSDEDYLGGLYKSFLDAIPGDVESSFREHLTNALKYLNRYSLKKRLEDIVERYADVLSEFIPSPQAFANDVAVARNYLTHYDPLLKDKAKKGKELSEICQRLRIILEVCLLLQLGMAASQVKELVSRNPRYQNAAVKVQEDEGPG